MITTYCFMGIKFYSGLVIMFTSISISDYHLVFDWINLFVQHLRDTLHKQTRIYFIFVLAKYIYIQIDTISYWTILVFPCKHYVRLHHEQLQLWCSRNLMEPCCVSGSTTVNKFFYLHNTPHKQKSRLASLYMEDEALHCFCQQLTFLTYSWLKVWALI